jgi:2-polyprenyl-3-methyl-5-hydroxy-6-metoxy-1,4-benzoquinol methylase
MSHSLEHVPDPRGMLKRTFEMLTPGGTLWVSLPNPRAIGARLYGLDWESYDVPRHLCLPELSVLKRAFVEAGFEVVRSRRRGAHSGRLYRRSAEIARMRGRRGLSASSLAARMLSLAVDLLATISVRYSEENIIIARKPNDLSAQSAA